MLSYAPPPRVTAPDEIDKVETFRNQVKTQNGTEIFILEFIPQGARFDDWSQLYAICAETPLEGTLQGHRNGQIQACRDACHDAPWQISPTTPAGAALFTMLCPSFKAEPDKAEVAVFSMILRGQTLVKNYYRMRVPAYQPDNPSGPDNLPVSGDELARAVAIAGKARLSDAKVSKTMRPSIPFCHANSRAPAATAQKTPGEQT